MTVAPTAELLDSIHRAETGALLKASVRMGGICAAGDSAQGSAQIDALSNYGEHIGLAFQIVDDILDVEESSEALGKTAGKDAKADKTTYVKLHGLEVSKRLAREQSEAALAALARLPGDKSFLNALINNMAARSH